MGWATVMPKGRGRALIILLGMSVSSLVWTVSAAPGLPPPHASCLGLGVSAPRSGGMSVPLILGPRDSTVDWSQPWSTVWLQAPHVLPS